MKGVRIDERALAMLMPLHLIFDNAGRIRAMGPALSSIAGTVTGRRLSDVVTFRRPQLKGDPEDVLAHPDRRLMIDLKTKDNGEPQRMRAMVVPLAQGGGLLQLGFGPDLTAAIRRHGLTAGDFSAVDPVMEVLYLLESQVLIRAELADVIARRERDHAIAAEEAATDRLTGLRNRRAMDRRLDELVSGGVGFGLMHLDLDHFKAVNDTLGHAAGDEVLERVARILREETRKGDLVARVGGDEFVLLIENCSDRKLMARIAKRILRRLAQPIPTCGQVCHISGSIGIVSSAGYTRVEAARLLSDADSALYVSKRSGRATFTFHGVDPDAAADRSGAPIDRRAGNAKRERVDDALPDGLKEPAARSTRVAAASKAGRVRRAAEVDTPPAAEVGRS
ncbi:GGDEF domain-containing protein [Jannaschia aquimarina]|uniref:guanylate cyclase n=1 Tax=Jannaschia aquimarina TaxID=935700 RepID=A0A0D1EEB6_9RHOB|nr:GGDEF domain-containing protein [Jannaschia aquimarina]KIT16049.1 Response regulator PleD [Jannaschia aquimarina]SNT01073.1 diguanylate cyclase (GGDEF) domain-containing protein [Jannaschia aquimarina]